MNLHSERTSSVSLSSSTSSSTSLSSTSSTYIKPSTKSSGEASSKTRTSSISLDKAKFRGSKSKSSPVSPTKSSFSTIKKFTLSQRRKSDSANSKSKLPKSLKRPISLATNKTAAEHSESSVVESNFNHKRSANKSFFSSKRKSSAIKEEQVPVSTTVTAVAPAPAQATDLSRKPSSQSSSKSISPTSMQLSSGRVVSFSEVGDRNGFPVFVFLGMGCVRYFIAFFDDLATSYNLRLICPDRPGIGLSDDVKAEEQQVLKWPDVIEELCDIMEIPKFFIMAHSAGAPYALACAMKIPQRLQGTIYLVSPWVSTTVANNFKWLQYVPTPIMKLTNSAGISLQQMIHGRQPYSIKPQSQRNSGALSAPMSTVEKKQQLGLAILKASFAENLAGANNDLLMCFERKRTFGFSYTDVNHPVHVFHGTKDDRIPTSAVKWMESNMPNCKLTMIEGGKHSLFLRAEVVDSIFKSIAVQLHDKTNCKLCKLFSKCWLIEEADNLRKEKELEIQRRVVEKLKNTVKRKQVHDSNMMRTGTSSITDHQHSPADQLTVYTYI
ncbi:12132_t:CDS:2 [Funneliformis geosporum]|uniref:13023_t:CDS:1 n=1 Tax=Funneliformis geosporum TaxID=1117311 RepID=A0A9W4SAS3_9GLOM|nr:12132_t:CDS:2 [Funneliformis geosporum]CAI2162519.1 13023_t:CDS:2 [Funneliformis geosporum]